MQTKEQMKKPIQKAAFLFTLFFSPMLMAQSYVVNLFEVRDDQINFYVDDKIPVGSNRAAGVPSDTEGLNYSVMNKDGGLHVRLQDTRSGYEHEQTFTESTFVDLNEEGLKILVRKVDSDVGSAQATIQRARRAGGVAGGSNNQTPRRAGGIAGGVIEQTLEQLENKR